jgi:transcriptional regulator with XRE-family HTH domain
MKKISKKLKFLVAECAFCYYIFAMNIKQYLKSTNTRAKELAEKAGVSAPYLSQLASNHRTPSKQLAKRLSIETNGEIEILHALFPETAETAETEEDQSA